jgi:hypothetical protein
MLVMTCLCLHHLSKSFAIQESSVIKFSQIKEVYKEIWPEALSVTLVYYVSLTVYPGLYLNLCWGPI